ncbi:AfsR/SARP family transcriptional regulator [Crossiella cryophila]|uniref:Putative ATPase/DNA-binding SARP family transcriptional activator n=1 Tax=Crossiella cryophila TaxID=43355 RepID=A0A7W7CCH6_9PSEU|nr:BTAD domain-containing putative transcriptional regulator [Crossiella cryophila]MBB4678626.1 putative ATPase/DNA-binding SARP family transcriptional activator [Crossiella cryophila]
MRYGVLGPLVVWTSAGIPVPVPETKVRALLANLLLHNGDPIPVDRLVEDLWAGSPPGRPRNALQAKVSQLRRALGRDEVLHQPAGYRLRLDADALDAERFRDLLRQARATADARARAGLLGAALALWRGAAYLDVCDAPFARAEITRLEELRLSAVEERAEARLELGEHAPVAEELGELVRQHPLRERLRMIQMRALYRTGRQGEALACFQDLRCRLAEELGVAPGPEIAGLHEAILRQEPELAAPVPAVRCRSNLPAPVTALIGRQQAIEEVSCLLVRGSGTRAVSLTGPGGVGKTRLAVAAAHSLSGDSPDGAWLVELAGLSPGLTEEDLAERIIATLGLCDTTTAEPEPVDVVHWLGQAVAERSPLLVLDNCEHVLEPVAALVAALLAAAPGLRVLITSHEALDIPGEVVRPVPPLAVPDQPDPALAARAGAVELFVQRAAAAVPGFALDADNVHAVVTICRRLDGIPLALELLAPRLRVLSPDQLAECLDDRFNLPIGRGRGRPARQQTLRAMIDWSWELLTEAERTVLSRLAVHPDGCVLAGAVAVCSGSGIPAERVLDLLSRLVDRSLVVRDGARFRLLESVAAYCLDRLAESGALTSARALFVRAGLDLAEQADRQLRGAEQHRHLELLDTETVNLRRALDTAVGTGDAAAALHLVNSLAWYWFLRGRLTEARRWFQAALAVPDGPEQATAVARAWLAGVELRTHAAGAGERAGELVAAIADPVRRARLSWFLGSALSGQTPGRELLAAALTGARAAGDSWGEAVALVERAARTEPEAMRADAEAGAALFRELGDRWGQLRATRALAMAAELGGDETLARTRYRAALAVAEELGLWTEAVETLSWLGRDALALGDTAQAEQLYQRARRISVERAYTRGEILAEAGLARTARVHAELSA